MCDDSIKEFEAIANKSVKETIEMFFEYPSGFHGDGGLQHYLYHRVFTNASSKIFWKNPADSDKRTLRFQSEVYTECTYQNKGNKPTSGRFDMAFIAPPTILEHGNSFPDERLKALIAFEVGRNKTTKGMGEYRAPKEKRDLKPGDAAKIIRDLRFKGLKGGYILEFFDPGKTNNAKEIARELSSFLENIERINCHIAVSVLDKDGNPGTYLYPDSWSKHIGLRYKPLDITTPSPPDPPGNLISYDAFLPKCGDCGRPLQEAIHEKYANQLKLLYGRKTMTVNKKPTGRVFRVGNKDSEYGECVCDMEPDFIEIIKKGPYPIRDGRLTILSHRDDQFIAFILTSLSAFLGF